MRHGSSGVRSVVDGLDVSALLGAIIDVGSVMPEYVQERGGFACRAGTGLVVTSATDGGARRYVRRKVEPA